MALRVAVFLLASLILVTARVSSHDGAPLEEVSLVTIPVKAPTPVPAPAPAPAPPAPVLGPHLVVDPKKECPGVCLGRCGKHSRPNLCNRACVSCCMVCKCVPPGTAGYREMCGTCYTDWRSHKNVTKCP